MSSALARFEAAVVRGRARHWASIPSALVARLRPRTALIADGLATCLGASEALRMNRTVGLGSRGRATAAAVDEIVDFYRAARCHAYSVEVAPGPQHDAIALWLRDRGFHPATGLAMLSRPLGPAIARQPGSWRVRRARRSEIETVMELFGHVFPVAASVRPWSLASAASRGEHYLAWPVLGGAGEVPPVAVATLVVDGPIAWLRGGATLTPWRRRGGQTALIAARLRRGARLGCTRAWSETAWPVPGQPDGSRRNLLRLGFEVVGQKSIFVRRDR